MKSSEFSKRINHIRWLGGITYKCTHCGITNEINTGGMPITVAIATLKAYAKLHMNCEPRKDVENGSGDDEKDK